MKIKEVWNGRLPKYWDITQWAILHEDLLFILNKIEGKRKLIELNLMDNLVCEKKTSANVILGADRNLVILGRLQDARSHISLSNVLAYNFKTHEQIWVNKEHYLIEKYKVPYIYKTGYFEIANVRVKLETGKLESIAQKNKISFKFDIGKYDLIKSWFYGVVNYKYCFLDTTDNVHIIDSKNGVKNVIHLNGLKKLSNTIKGDFDIGNNGPFNNTTLADAVINNKYVAWVNTDNNIVIFNYIENSSFILSHAYMDHDLCLSSINDRYILAYGIKDYEEGSIIVIDMED